MIGEVFSVLAYYNEAAEEMRENKRLFCDDCIIG
jgi:hypothetical protein